MKAIFCGTPEIAVPSLEALCGVAEIVGVVCQPDRPAGRGMKMRAPAVKERAVALGLSVFQPEKVRDGTLANWMRDKRADVAVVIAYGRILTAETLAAPRLGCVNLHASILPAYRGAAPIQRAVIDGQTETGVCLMKMDEGMDTGAVLSCRKIPILPEDTAGTMAAKLGLLAAEITREDVPRYVQGKLTPIPQANDAATYAPPLIASDALLDFSQSATSIHNRIRGLSPHPGAKTFIHRAGQSARGLKIHATRLAEVMKGGSAAIAPGAIRVLGSSLWVGTGTVPLEIVVAQVEGKKAQTARDLLNGRALCEGDVLGFS